jgi:preprotein translocase subunit YajC
MLNFILLQAGGPENYINIIFLIGIGIVIYFFMIRPQQKRQKDQKTFIENIKKGDMVVTIGGIHAKVAAVEDTAVILEVDKGVKIKFEKTAISLEASKQYA